MHQLVDKMKLNIADNFVDIADNIGSLLMRQSVALIACEMKTREKFITERERKDLHTLRFSFGLAYHTIPRNPHTKKCPV